MIMNNKVKTYARPPEPHQNNENSLTWIDTVERRCISKNTLRKYDVRCIDEKITFPFYENNKIVNSKSVNRIRDGKNKVMSFIPNCKPVLFGLNTIINGWRTLMITEGEIDALSLYDMGFKNCVSVPNGAKSHTWIDNSIEFLAQFREIFLLFDADKAGIDGAEFLKSKMPDQTIVKIVNLTNLFDSFEGGDCTDINDLHRIGEKEFIKKMINLARDSRARLIVDPSDATESQQREYLQGGQSIASSGFDCVDRFVLGKGHIRASEISVLTGGAGSGKSEFCNNMAINIARQGVGVFIASFEQEHNEQLSLMNNCLVGREYTDIDELNKMSNRVEAEKIKNQNLVDMSRLNDWLSLNRLRLFNCSNLLDKDIIKNLFDAMEYSAKIHGSKVFILDPISVIMDVDSNNQAQTTRELILKTKDFAKRHKAHVFLVMHPRKTDKKDKIIDESSLFGSSLIFNFINNFFSLWRFRTPDEDYSKVSARMKNTIRFFCFKNRKRGELRDSSTQLYFDIKTKRYSEIRTFESGGMVDFVETSVPVFLDSFENYSGTMKRYSKEIIEDDLKDLKESYIQANNMGDE